MQNLSVREFEELCNALSPKQFIFTSENQSWNKVEHTAKVSLTFPIMLIALNPNVICFKNKDNFLRLDRVKCIKRLEKKSMLGEVFTVICGDFGNNSKDVSYTIIAQ